MRSVTFDLESTEARFIVLVNQEEQYALWPADLPVPGGWSQTGCRGTLPECEAYLEEHWTDLRPRSLRSWLAQVGRD
jgi:MbtH protein